MLVAIVLVLATLVAWVVGRRSADWRAHARRGMAAAMIVAGMAHLAGPDPFVQHLPTWVPSRPAIVFVSGLVEIGFGVALFAWRSRQAEVGRILASFFVIIWPANVYVAAAGVDVEGQPGGAYPWIRLPFQVLFVAWALWSTREVPATDEPNGMPTVPAATPVGG